MATPWLETLATGVLVVDNASPARLNAWNPAAADLLQLPGTPPDEPILAAIDPGLAEALGRFHQRGQSLQISELLIERSQLLVDVHLQAVGSDQVLIELHPVTERVRQREMTDKADRQQALALLARALAHEIRNPLAGVRGAAQLIEAIGADPAAQRHARMIQREVDRITRLIERFAEAAPEERDAVNLHQILDETLELVCAESPASLSIERRFDPSIPDILASSGPLHQLFLNLLRNAVQAEARHLTLSSRIEHHSALVDRPARHAIQIDIDDDGIGVQLSLRDKLFLPMVSGRDQGSGFGLAVVQQIARSHGGLVEYLPLANGSRFRVRLPLITPGATSSD
ncbi:MAG: two-component system sensor histidine kinase NtrB [Wenzhouxiangella sp.]